MKMKLRSLFAVSLLSSAMLLGSMEALAGELSVPPDLDEKGTINVTIQDQKTDTVVPSGTLGICKVADLVIQDDGAMLFRLTPEFADSGVSLENLNDETIPATLFKYEKENNIQYTEQPERNAGIRTFSDLSLGVYLIHQVKGFNHHYDINPFLVSLPVTSESGDSWVYTVDASPKVATRRGGGGGGGGGGGTTPGGGGGTPDIPDIPGTPASGFVPGILPRTGQQKAGFAVAFAGAAGLIALFLVTRRKKG